MLVEAGRPRNVDGNFLVGLWICVGSQGPHRPRDKSQVHRQWKVAYLISVIHRGGGAAQRSQVHNHILFMRLIPLVIGIIDRNESSARPDGSVRCTG
jgi:hypothetical protein